jgi:cytochrome c553
MAAALLITGHGQAQQDKTSEFAAFDPAAASIENGRAVVVGAFAAAPGETEITPQQGACFQCHGMDGKGDGAAAFPRIGGQFYHYLYNSLKNYASGARQNPVMSPIAAALTDQQMRDVAAYYAAQTSAPAVVAPEQATDAVSLQYGAAIAAVGHAQRGVQGCANCHGPQGAGLAPVYPYLAGQHAGYIEAQLQAWKSGERKGDPLSIMENISKRLSAEEIKALAAYYAALPPPGAMTQAGQEIEPLPQAEVPPVQQ